MLSQSWHQDFLFLLDTFFNLYKDYCREFRIKFLMALLTLSKVKKAFEVLISFEGVQRQESFNSGDAVRLRLDDPL